MMVEVVLTTGAVEDQRKERIEQIQTFRPDQRTVHRNPDHHSWSPDLSLGKTDTVACAIQQEKRIQRKRKKKACLSAYLAAYLYSLHKVSANFSGIAVAIDSPSFLLFAQSVY